MANIGGKKVNPFYRSVDGVVRGELSARAEAYGALVRSGMKNEAGTLLWSYGKTAWAQIFAPGGPSLGTAYSPLMSNAEGKLTLYDSTRNQPKYPLLQSVELSNEGTIGSLLKGSFTFTMWPDITSSGFAMEGIEEAYFKPGREVTIAWGWSVRSGGANSGRFTGIIYNFDWSVNGDLSITAKVSIVSKATVAIGVSGEQTNPTPSDEPVEDPLGVPIPDGDLAGIIEADIATLSQAQSASTNNAVVKTYGPESLKGAGKTYGLYYISIGMPKSVADTPADPAPPAQGQTQAQPTQPPQPITEPVYYMRLGRLVELVNKLIEKAPSPVLKDLFVVQCDGNFTQWLPEVVSTAPERVFFPDESMGKYGASFSPVFSPEVQLKTGAPSGNSINIGNILVSTSVIIETYRSFVKENQTSIEYKNITGFFDKLIQEVNYASGETYQLATQLVEPLRGSNERAILSIEDTNLSDDAIKEIKPFKFTATISKPILKSVSISCKPPAASAAAAYTQARGGGPQQVDVKHDNVGGGQEFEDAKKAITDTREGFVKEGAGEGFTSKLKGNLAKYKRGSTTGHWLNKVLYPIEFTVTIDGIDGFKFGDVLATNLIPSRYNSEGMVFVITKISHSIQNGVWETTLNTKSRIKPQGNTSYK